MVAKPIWTEGLLLSQHHFQHQDRYHEELLSDRVGSVVHYPWGITGLEIDSRRVKEGDLDYWHKSNSWFASFAPADHPESL